MTAAPLETGPHDELAGSVASAAAAVLPAAETLMAGDPQPGNEHVTRVFSAAVLADLAGARTGRLALLVGSELTDALGSAPGGGLDVAAAVQPALDAAAQVLGATAQAAEVVELDEVVDRLCGEAPYTAVTLLGGSIAGAVLLPNAVLADAEGVEEDPDATAGQATAEAAAQVAAAAEAAATSTLPDPQAGAAAAAQTLPPTAAPSSVQPAAPAEVAGVTGAPVPVAAPSAPVADSLPPVATVRSIADGRRGIDMLAGVEMEVTVELGRTRMPVRELLALAPGTVLALDRAAGSPADLLVNGRLVARGEVVVVDEDFGLRVTEILDQTQAV
ncbi:flagellar motor switch protein FliN [Nocardioides bruguierae]|uniref:Flagellar motor switch protein FliN n=1 Tax=Nocardioides bruguierae TaxID=2945102 RepID=A0A9X2IH00_9ACTN|nr:flagellar motor switch protein FliN [Nocardioides bruguierae]MCL8027686.1 flagellar motor switch protein FliN [Nocardioides bruguierae]MCM0622553.1 flagellar motor switch protein FliN [Nocardioides bruguierae]